jgi:WD40 repeat protein
MVQLWEAGSGKEEKILPTDGDSLSTEQAQTGTANRFVKILIDTWIVYLTWSPNSRRLAQVDAHGKVQIWDLAADKQNGLLLGTHSGGVHSAAWSPDSNRLASIGGDGVVKVWDPPNPKPRELTSPVSPEGAISSDPSYAITWTDGEHLSVVSGGTGEIRVLDAGSGAVVSTRKLVYRDRAIEQGVARAFPRRFHWGPGARQFASTAGGDVKIWDAGTGKEGAWIGIPGAAGAPTPASKCALAWDQSGRRLALGGADGTVSASSIVGSRQPVRALHVPNPLGWSWDGQHVLGTAGIQYDHKAAREQWEKQMKVMEEAIRRGFGPPPPNLQPGQGGIVRPILQPQIQIRDAITGELVRTTGDTVQPDVLADCPDRGKWLASATRAGLLQLWPRAEGAQAVPLEQPRASGARVGGSRANRLLLTWSPDGTRLAFSTDLQSSIRLWDPLTQKMVRTLPGHDKPLWSLAWSPDSQRLASAGDDGTVRVWDVLRGEETSSFPYYLKHGFSDSAFSTLSWCLDGKRLAVADDDNRIRVWDVDARHAVATLHGHPSPGGSDHVTCAVAWSSDGRRLASASTDGILLWDTATWQEVLTLRVPSSFQRFAPLGTGGMLAWSPDRWQLGFFVGGSVTIWDATPEEEEPRH